MTKAHSLVVLSYVLALLAAWFTLPFVADQHVLVQIFIADVVATLVIFGFSFIFKNSSFYDAYWSVIPVVIAAYLIGQVLSSGAGEPFRYLLLFLVVYAWGARLTANWLYTWTGLNHEDWRYKNLAEQSGIFWWPVSLLGIHLMPTVIVFLGCIPMYYAIVEVRQGLNLFDGLAFFIGVVSIYLEYQSDVELHDFRQTRSSRLEVLDQGLWRHCRHPNYLGEIGVWVSIFLFGYAGSGQITGWMISGPLAMIILFALISIPMIEKKLAGDKPGYAEYKARTFALLPLSAFKR